MGAATAERYVRQPTTGQYGAQFSDPAAFAVPMYRASPMAAANFLPAAAPGSLYPGGPIPPPWTADQPVQYMTPSAAPTDAAAPLPLHTWTGHYPFRNVQFPTPYQGEGWYTQGRPPYGNPLPMRVEWEHSPSLRLGEVHAHTLSARTTDGGNATDSMRVDGMPGLGEVRAHTLSARTTDGGNATDSMRVDGIPGLGEVRAHTLSTRTTDGGNATDSVRADGMPGADGGSAAAEEDMKDASAVRASELGNATSGVFMVSASEASEISEVRSGVPMSPPDVESDGEVGQRGRTEVFYATQYPDNDSNESYALPREDGHPPLRRRRSRAALGPYSWNRHDLPYRHDSNSPSSSNSEMSERSRARRDAKARKRRLAERAGSGSGSDHSVAGSQGVADLTQTISDAVVAKLQQLHSENAGGEPSAEVSLGQTPGATQSSQSLSIPAVVAKTQQPQPGNADGEPSAEVSLGQTPGATRTSQPPPSPEDSLSQIARVEEARRKSSEGLTMEEAIKLGFLTVEFPPMKDDMSKPQGLSMELATKLGFLSESHHAAVVTEMVGASNQVCDSTNPKSGTQRAEGRVAKVSFEMDNHADPPPSRRPYQMSVEELRKLRESIDPVRSDSQSGVACRQLARMRRSSLDTIVIDGSDSSPAVANDSIGTEEEQWRRISKEKWKAVDRKKAYDGAPLAFPQTVEQKKEKMMKINLNLLVDLLLDPHTILLAVTVDRTGEGRC
ncbi:hypothetical protein CYMTET_40977 [Cymbomonas tetramitiformis]|uniref:Uncharacterized protein n=1 Tax=Cymbomonas tetramitiformis TaxID=36881 RepID=A0AAE0C710_9CHLO|nr:hypothetical protein CYMTET_40977 [Cymbomonas tetramitiformis]